MNQKDSTLIRVTRSLKSKLEQLGASWAKMWAEGRMDVPPPNDQDVVSLDRVIAELLRRDEEHRRRSKRDSKPTGPWDREGKLKGPEDLLSGQ